MILVDTAVWIDHLRDNDPHLAGLLDAGAVLGHPWVTGKLALGSLQNRVEILRLLDDLPQATIATATEVRELVEQHKLFSLGIGYVDAQLLAATMLTPDADLWTRDRRLHAAAQRLGVAHAPQTDG
ncbi:MAG TPA: type II toxin-antitoxin system VapC family toxin [Solirubrobacteraceae bacterium]|nr:type II toxin-antitoxin system VapC family toxin [Solirubrobacteraceae bacterium]